MKQHLHRGFWGYYFRLLLFFFTCQLPNTCKWQFCIQEFQGFWMLLGKAARISWDNVCCKNEHVLKAGSFFKTPVLLQIIKRFKKKCSRNRQMSWYLRLWILEGRPGRQDENLLRKLLRLLSLYVKELFKSSVWKMTLLCKCQRCFNVIPEFLAGRVHCSITGERTNWNQGPISDMASYLTHWQMLRQCATGS